VIDYDFTGNVTVVLHNSADTTYKISKGDRIAQLILVSIATPPVTTVTNLQNTDRGDKGFGSTGTTVIINNMQPESNTHYDTTEPDPLPYDIYFSQDPFDQLLEVEIPMKGNHEILGIEVTQCQYRQCLCLTDMVLSTPGSHIPKWRSTFCNSYIYGIHPQEDIPQLYFDQLSIIAKHLRNAKKHNTPTIRTTQNSNSFPEEDTAQSFTLKQLKQRPDWPEWQKSRYKMLDQYKEQGMFSNPMPLPTNANALHMLWTYLLKVCGTRKGRLICNGNPRQKGTVTIGHTYANALDAVSGYSGQSKPRKV
jgi:hypothetical protein